MRKEKYYDLEMEIIRFDNDDIINESVEDANEITNPEEIEDGGEL